MRTFKIILFFALLPILSFAQSSNKDIGMDFIKKLFDENYSKAYAYFDETIRSQVSTDDLEQVVQTLNQQLGSYQKNLEINQEEIDGLEVFYYYSEFEKQKLDIQVSFNKEGKIAGFHFIPHKEFDKKKVK